MRDRALPTAVIGMFLGFAFWIAVITVAALTDEDASPATPPTTYADLPATPSQCVTVGWRAVFVEGGVATIEDARCK